MITVKKTREKQGIITVYMYASKAYNQKCICMSSNLIPDNQYEVTRCWHPIYYYNVLFHTHGKYIYIMVSIYIVINIMVF